MTFFYQKKTYVDILVLACVYAEGFIGHDGQKRVPLERAPYLEIGHVPSLSFINFDFLKNGKEKRPLTSLNQGFPQKTCPVCNLIKKNKNRFHSKKRQSRQNRPLFLLSESKIYEPSNPVEPYFMRMSQHNLGLKPSRTLDCVLQIEAPRMFVELSFNRKNAVVQREGGVTNALLKIPTTVVLPQPRQNSAEDANRTRRRHDNLNAQLDTPDDSGSEKARLQGNQADLPSSQIHAESSILNPSFVSGTASRPSLEGVSVADDLNQNLASPTTGSIHGGNSPRSLSQQSFNSVLEGALSSPPLSRQGHSGTPQFVSARERRLSGSEEGSGSRALVSGFFRGRRSLSSRDLPSFERGSEDVQGALSSRSSSLSRDLPFAGEVRPSSRSSNSPTLQTSEPDVSDALNAFSFLEDDNFDPTSTNGSVSLLPCSSNSIERISAPIAGNTQEGLADLPSNISLRRISTSSAISLSDIELEFDDEDWGAHQLINSDLSESEDESGDDSFLDSATLFPDSEGDVLCDHNDSNDRNLGEDMPSITIQPLLGRNRISAMTVISDSEDEVADLNLEQTYECSSPRSLEDNLIRSMYPSRLVNCIDPVGCWGSRAQTEQEDNAPAPQNLPCQQESHVLTGESGLLDISDPEDSGFCDHREENPGASSAGLFRDLPGETMFQSNSRLHSPPLRRSRQNGIRSATPPQRQSDYTDANARRRQSLEAQRHRLNLVSERERRRQDAQTRRENILEERRRRAQQTRSPRKVDVPRVDGHDRRRPPRGLSSDAFQDDVT